MPTVLSRETIRAAQILLVGLGFPLDMDGIAGPRTRKAVKEFQRRRQLPVTGELDTATLNALGLQTIEFTNTDTEVPELMQRRIKEYVDRVEREHDSVLRKTREGLTLFQTTLATASVAEADPDLVRALGSAAYAAGGALLESFIENSALAAGFTFVHEFALATAEELERAAAATVDRRVASIVERTIVSIDVQRDRFNKDELEEEVTLRFLEAADRRVFFDRLEAATERLKTTVLPPVSFFELKCYEAWINMHFDGFKEDGHGVVAYRFGFDDLGIEVLSCRVDAPHGERIEDKVNSFLAVDAIPGVRRPIDLHVRKRASFRVKNPDFPAVLIERSGWLGAKNQVLKNPSVKKAEEGFNEPVWRQAASRFMH